ncbi:hypothetical protein TNCV_1589491 [Trichonephila clavipes]|uniref:Uncharacterized protein n=1 Tax=Trichonephila clavipes TaxID=2585209 RepID=A0A8X6REY7_TRICX|nr:hypothetical protein TNCV_1589491 [Trichonephila clavipes]
MILVTKLRTKRGPHRGRYSGFGPSWPMPEDVPVRMSSILYSVPLRHDSTLNNSRASSALVRLAGGALTTPRVFSLEVEVEPSQNVLSPAWCSKLRLTTRFHLALCRDEFLVTQVALVTTTTTST